MQVRNEAANFNIFSSFRQSNAVFSGFGKHLVYLQMQANDLTNVQEVEESTYRCIKSVFLMTMELVSSKHLVQDLLLSFTLYIEQKLIYSHNQLMSHNNILNPRYDDHWSIKLDVGLTLQLLGQRSPDKVLHLLLLPCHCIKKKHFEMKGWERWKIKSRPSYVLASIVA